MRAMERPMINHRGPKFARVLSDVIEGAKQIFRTTNDIIVFPSSGTGGLEAAIVNMLSPGDKILVVNTGVFGERVGEIARRYGANVEMLNVTWGEALNPAVLAARLQNDPRAEIKAVFVTHNETSTGIANDIQGIRAAMGNHPALLMVDAVSSLGAIDLRTDEWAVDVVITASQKAFISPPGVVLISISEKAWRAAAQAKMPCFYWDFKTLNDAIKRGETPYTPALTQLYGLQEAVKILLEEGVDAVLARHARMAEATRIGVQALGLELFANPNNASTVVTAIKAPAGIDIERVRQIMLDKYGVVIAGGHQTLRGKIFRIGHLGQVNMLDILATFAALEMSLLECGYPVELGIGVSAIQKYFLNSR